MKVNFSIRYKILLMTSALLLTSVSLYILLATKIFRDDKTAFVYSSNKTLVTALAAQAEMAFRTTTDKLRLFAMLSSEQYQVNSKALVQDIVATDPNIVRLELYEIGANQNNKLITSFHDPQYSRTYGLRDDYYQVLSAKRPIPFEKIQADSVYVWNGTIEDGPPLIGIGLSVIIEGANRTPEKILQSVGYIKADSFLKNINMSTLAQIFIVDKSGQILVHKNSSVMARMQDMSNLPIVAELFRSQFQSGVSKFSVGGIEMLGAYAKVPFSGTGIISQVESREAFMAVNRLAGRSILFGAIIITATFLAIVLFSRTLTRPLNRLLDAVENVSQGNLNTSIELNSRDEIAILSRSFNQMIEDLKTSRNQLEEVNRDLEQKVIDRTKKIEEQNRAVQEAKEALLKTTRLASVGEIAGRTAHEVLNPLTSLMTRIQKVQKRLNEVVSNDKEILAEIIKAWNDDLQSKGLEGFVKSLNGPSLVHQSLTILEEDLSNLKDISSRWEGELSTLDSDTKFLFREASRIETILKQMLSLSVVSRTHSMVNIHSILHDAVNITADAFSKAKIKVIEKYEANDDKIKADPSELLQVLSNLLRNSIQAITMGDVQEGLVTIYTSNVDSRIQIDIVDNGIGVSEENKPKLFVHQFSTKDPRMGTGLGLSISRRFVRAIQGDLTLVSSQPRVETRFRIEIPLYVDKSKQEAAA